MLLKGWVRTSLIDFPDHIATVLFAGGCNFRCPMCHNADLVLQADTLPTLPEDVVYRYLEKRAGKVTGLVVTGGEPTLQPDLADFLYKVRAYGVRVKLDTNGYRPNVLEALLEAALVDFVAMDVKAPPEKYSELSGLANIDLSRVEQSLSLLARFMVLRDLRCEFRTTVVPGHLDEDDVLTIAQWIADICGTKGGEGGGRYRYVLQQFRAVNTLDPALEDVSPYPTVLLRRMADQARTWVPQVLLRGV